MKSGRVFVVGSLHYDIVLNAPRLPGHDETVMGDSIEFVCGGKGGNQAVAASQHGAKVSFAGAVGRDFFADALMANLEKAGIDTGHIRRCESVASGLSVAIVEANGDYGAVVASGANQSIEPSRVTVPEDTRLLILQNEIPEPANLSAARDAQKIGGQVLLNAAPMRDLGDKLLSLVDVLIVNRVEAEALFKKSIGSPGNAFDVLKDCSLPCSTIVITMGGAGLVFTHRGSAPLHLAAQEVKTISSHGAGDAFTGALGARLVFGDEMMKALRYASAAAALHVSTPVERRDAIGHTAVKNFSSRA